MAWLKDIACALGFHFKPKGTDTGFIWICLWCHGLQAPRILRKGKR